MLYIVWSLIFLLICAVIDLKEQKVFSILCFTNAVAVLIVHIVLQDVSWLNILFGMILGGLFFVVAIVTKEAIGKGDAIVIFTLGSMLGIKTSFQIIVWAAITCAITAIMGIVSKRVTLKSRIPFVPFMLIGGIITFAIQGG